MPISKQRKVSFEIGSSEITNITLTWPLKGQIYTSHDWHVSDMTKIWMENDIFDGEGGN